MEKYFGAISVLCAIVGVLALFGMLFGVVYEMAKLDRDSREGRERHKHERERLDAAREQIERERLEAEERSRRLNEYYRNELGVRLRPYIKYCDRSQNKKGR